MKKISKKALIALMSAVVIAASAPVMVMAADIDTDDDDDVDQVIAVAEDEPIKSDIENSPAVRNNNQTNSTPSYGVIFNNDYNQANDNNLTNNNNINNNQTLQNQTQQDSTHYNIQQTEPQQISGNTTQQQNETLNPGTGAPSLAMPIGTMLLSLGTIAAAMRKRK